MRLVPRPTTPRFFTGAPPPPPLAASKPPSPPCAAAGGCAAGAAAAAAGCCCPPPRAPIAWANTPCRGAMAADQAAQGQALGGAAACGPLIDASWQLQACKEHSVHQLEAAQQHRIQATSPTIHPSHYLDHVLFVDILLDQLLQWRAKQAAHQAAGGGATRRRRTSGPLETPVAAAAAVGHRAPAPGPHTQLLKYDCSTL